VTGTLINIVTVLLGGSLGILFGARLPERIRETVVAGLGLFTAAIGVQMFLDAQNVIVVLASLLFGGLIGEWWQIEAKLSALGEFFEERFADRGASTLDHSNLEKIADQPLVRGSSPFIQGFLTASLVFCVGPMTILGSIQDGLTGDYRLLAIKSILDGFAALAFASTLGMGVLFSTVVILLYQGGLSLLASQAQAIITAQMMNEMTAVGGLLIFGIAVSSLLKIKHIRVGNFLPALAIAPLIVALLGFTGVTLP